MVPRFDDPTMILLSFFGGFSTRLGPWSASLSQAEANMDKPHEGPGLKLRGKNFEPALELKPV